MISLNWETALQINLVEPYLRHKDFSTYPKHGLETNAC